MDIACHVQTLQLHSCIQKVWRRLTATLAWLDIIKWTSCML